jgi:hypothetical protein
MSLEHQPIYIEPPSLLEQRQMVSEKIGGLLNNPLLHGKDVTMMDETIKLNAELNQAYTDAFELNQRLRQEGVDTTPLTHGAKVERLKPFDPYENLLGRIAGCSYRRNVLPFEDAA